MSDERKKDETETDQASQSERDRQRASDLVESDFAQDKMGNNQLQGDDQDNVHNERRAVPDAKTDTDGVVESFEKLDKDERAKRDLGKGNRS